MRSALLVGVVALSLSLFATGQGNSTGSPGSKPSKQTANTVAEGDPAGPENLVSAKGFVLEDSTPVRLRLNRPVSSADSHVGDTVDFEVLQDISVNGTLVIAKGWFAFGTVTKAEPKKRAARGGRVEIKIEYVRLLDSERAPLRAVQGGKGGGHVGAMTAAIAASGVLFFPAAPFFLFIHGKDITIPKGAEVTAYINGDVALDITKFQKSNLSPAGPAALNYDGEPDATDTAGQSTDSSARRYAYTSQYFALSYPLPPEWVLETELVRNRLTSEKQLQDAALLLAAVHIPQDTTELRADSSLMLLATNRSAQADAENCTQYLDTLATKLSASRIAKRKGEMSEYTVAAREFSRVNFDYSSGTSAQAVICSPARDSLLLWKIEGSNWESVEDAASTIYAIVPWRRAKPSQLAKSLAEVHLSQNDALSLLVRKVNPVYPAEARDSHIQGTVRMQAEISKTGVVETLELVEGPIELAVSAATAVRRWKFRPYVQNGEPVPVTTVIVLNYSFGAS